MLLEDGSTTLEQVGEKGEAGRGLVGGSVRGRRRLGRRLELGVLAEGAELVDELAGR